MKAGVFAAIAPGAAIMKCLAARGSRSDVAGSIIYPWTGDVLCLALRQFDFGGSGSPSSPTVQMPRSARASFPSLLPSPSFMPCSTIICRAAVIHARSILFLEVDPEDSACRH